tara:strand:- start:3526 stop:4539 length:1014 start_codon:yes stop_codon:yes gene_type:complete
MTKGVFLCVGTGGHVLPAYNIIKSMLNQGVDKKNILIVTDERGIEYFKDKDFEIIVYPFVSSRKGISGYLLNLSKIFKSIIYLYKTLKKFKPQFLFTTGAYIAPISAIVSKLLNVNFYIQEQNIYSGLGNKISAPLANIVYTSFPGTKNIQKSKIQYCGPILNLDLNKSKSAKISNFTIGFQGGSQGSTEINELVYKFCEDRRYSDIDIIHIVGKNNEIINSNRINYFPHSYINDMESFYNSIDLQVSRAGGGILEAAYLNIYQLLIPFKHGTTSAHQLLNAEYLEKLNAAKIINNYDDFTNEIDYFIENKTKTIIEFNIEAGNSIISKKLVDELIK